MINGHEVFVSYKFSDGVKTRDAIIKRLGITAHIYNGEKGYKASNVADETLKKYLSDMIYGTSVTLVIISPEVIKSDWVNWEIQYSLEVHTRNDRTNQRNGILCVIQEKEDLATHFYNNIYGYNKTTLNSDWAYINRNRYKRLNKNCFPDLVVENSEDTFDPFLNSFISALDEKRANINTDDYCIIVPESVFMANPDKYINEAFERSRNFDKYKAVTRIGN